MLSRSVSSYNPRASPSTTVASDPRDRRLKPRVSCPPVPTEASSPVAVDEHAERLTLSGEQLMQVLAMWSVHRKAVWQVSATFARFSNECNASASVFSAAGADATYLKTIPSELRPMLEQLMSEDPSIRRFELFKPSLDAIVARFLGELRTIKERHGLASVPKPAPLLKSPSVNMTLEAFVKSIGKLKDAIDIWSVKETSGEDIRAGLDHLDEDFKALSTSFSERGIDLKSEIAPIFEELKTLVEELVTPGIAGEWDEPFSDQLNALLIRLLSGLKSKQAQLSQAREQIKRRATFRLRTSIFEEQASNGPRLPSTLSRSHTGRNFTS